MFSRLMESHFEHIFIYIYIYFHRQLSLAFGLSVNVNVIPKVITLSNFYYEYILKSEIHNLIKFFFSFFTVYDFKESGLKW
jgi:hypothetical protein